MVQQTNKTDNTCNEINQNEDEEKILAHGWHNGNIKTQQKNQTSVNDQHDDIGRKNKCVETVECKKQVFFCE